MRKNLLFLTLIVCNLHAADDAKRKAEAPAPAPEKSASVAAPLSPRSVPLSPRTAQSEYPDIYSSLTLVVNNATTISTIEKLEGRDFPLPGVGLIARAEAMRLSRRKLDAINRHVRRMRTLDLDEKQVRENLDDAKAYFNFLVSLQPSE